jgi:iron(III) transport system ATP-binding protein
MARVEFRNIALNYGGTQVLRGISLVVEPGEFFALLGPSGSGKSTLLRVLAGFSRPQAGQVLIDGADIGTTPPWERNVGMVFQNYALWPHLTVERNVAFGLEERRVPAAEVKRRVAEALALVGLEGFAARRPNQLSGGQQQRVALARTIVIEPRVLLLDEPLSNLDAKLRHHMRREILALQRKLGVTTIFVTHDQEEALTMSDRIAVMDQGVIQQVGAPTELYDRPVNRFVADFVGTVNFVKGRIESRAADHARFSADGFSGIELPLPLVPDGLGQCEISFRPHMVEIAVPGAPLLPGYQWLAGSIVSGEFSGEFVRYVVATGGREIIVDRPRAAGASLFKHGDAVLAGIPINQIRVLAG